MAAKVEPHLCVVCSAPLPTITREEAIRKNAATVIGDQTYYHCAGGRHSPEQIQMSIAAVPRFSTARKEQPTHGVRDGILYRPTRSECPFVCHLCDSVQRKTCEEMDAAMVKEEKAGELK